MDERIETEIARLKAGPQVGYFTFLHHENPVEESSNLFERINYILTDKPKDQIYDRLRHIYPVPATAWKAYQEAKASAEKAYQEAIASAEKAYQEAIASAEKAVLAIIPNCAWDGKSIFGDRKEV